LDDRAVTRETVGSVMQTWPAPAKLNRFLHILGQQEDGYHLLQSIIQFVDLCDQLSFTAQDDESIRCFNSNSSVLPENDLCVRAAQLLQSKMTTVRGVQIRVEKNIPIGAGMGGGSSDAATTLIALNEIWDAGFGLDELEQMGKQLGADVPVFIRGHACWVEGVGEQLSPITLPEPWFVIIYPDVQLSTQEMFSNPDLTRSSEPLKIRDFLKLSEVEEALLKTQNVFEPIARRHPAVDRAFQVLNQYAPAKLTGSGSTLFAQCESESQAKQISQYCENEFTTYVAKGLNQSPVISRSEYNYPNT